jgi:hypothetical protein
MLTWTFDTKWFTHWSFNHVSGIIFWGRALEKSCWKALCIPVSFESQTEISWRTQCVKWLIKTNNLFLFTFCNCTVRFKCSAHICVLIFSHTVANSVMTNISNILAIFNLLNKVMFSSPVNWIMFLNLVRETRSGYCLKFESLDQLILTCQWFTCNSYHADVYTTNKLTNNKTVTGKTSIVGVVVILSIICGF